MINSKIKKNSGLARKNVRSTLGGFTLVETMFAILILTFTIVGLMTIVANSLFAARYAKDEITVNYLLQEVVDYVRNDRDTTVFIGGGAGPTSTTWDIFTNKYTGCASDKGCYFDVLHELYSASPTNPRTCEDSGCPNLYYDENAKTDEGVPFYLTDDGSAMKGKKTNFIRKIVMKSVGTDEIDVTVTIDWKNGSKTMSRSLSTSLMKWQ